MSSKRYVLEMKIWFEESPPKIEKLKFQVLADQFALARRRLWQIYLTSTQLTKKPKNSFSNQSNTTVSLDTYLFSFKQVAISITPCRCIFKRVLWSYGIHMLPRGRFLTRLKECQLS